jgi:hypothetical protein
VLLVLVLLLYFCFGADLVVALRMRERMKEVDMYLTGGKFGANYEQLANVAASL